ncbi:MAG: DUF6320 domain-containing protein [Eubacteriales bacterium]|nr:DUF6320 domain-containing protein [Eubacteriales bacterium]
MKRCRQCDVWVDSDGAKCPLCYADLECAQDGAGGAPGETYPQLGPAQHNGPGYHVVSRIFLFLSLLAAAVSLSVNFLVDRMHTPWSLLVVGGIPFVWLLVRYVIMGKVNIARRLMTQLLGSAGFVLLLEWFLRGSIYQGWALTYAIPFMNVAATLAITMILCVRYLRWTAYTLYQFLTALLGLLPLLFWLMGWITPGIWWPSLASAFYSLATLAGMFIFVDRKYKNELIRRFHL